MSKQQYKSTKYEGIYLRNGSIIIDFRYQEKRYRETLKGISPTPNNLKVASNKRGKVLTEISLGTFDYTLSFPNSKHAIKNNVHTQKVTIGELMVKWHNLTNSNLMPVSVRTYLSKSKIHILPKWKNTVINDIKKSDIENWIVTVLMKKLENNTINNVLIGLRAIFKQAEEDEVISKNVMKHVKNLKVKDSEADPFSNEEIDLIKNVETARKSELNGFLFACNSSLSVSELLALAWEDIDLENGIVHVRRANVDGIYKVPKETSRTRDLELLDEAKDILLEQKKISFDNKRFTIKELQRDRRSWVERDLRFVFLNTNFERETDWRPLKNDQEYRIKFFKDILMKSGVRYRGPNCARHTFASRLLTAGVPKEWIREQMGHTTTKMIDKHYGKWIKVNKPNMARFVSNLLKKE